MTHIPSGRPEPGEYAAYAQHYFDLVEGDDAVTILAELDTHLLDRLGRYRDEQLTGLTYAPGKWTVKEIIGHLTDDERIFAYRALCVARGDAGPLPDFDENAYMRHPAFEARTLDDLLEEHRTVRAASLSLFSSFSDLDWLRLGTVSSYEASVRGLAFHIAGHELHHLKILDERYFPRLD